MQDMQQWVDKNRPNNDLDYQRLAEVTLATESEMRQIGSVQVLGRRFDYEAALKYGVRRIQETSQEVKLENPSWETWLPVLRSAWSEGFIFGSLAYTQENRGRKAEAFLDRIALANINHTLSTASQNNIDEIYSKAVSPKALRFVSTTRSIRASQVVQSMSPVADHQRVSMALAGHWLDGFLAGLVFQEMGGHREAA